MHIFNEHTDFFKKIIVIFWTIWWFIALWTDVVGVLAHNGLLQKSWAPDVNYPMLVTSLKMYAVPQWVLQVTFAGIIVWLLFCFLAFLWACCAVNKPRDRWYKRVHAAFMISLALWFAFLIGDQLVMNFDLEANHMVQAGFQLLTYLLFYPTSSQLQTQRSLT